MESEEKKIWEMAKKILGDSRFFVVIGRLNIQDISDLISKRQSLRVYYDSKHCWDLIMDISGRPDTEASYQFKETATKYTKTGLSKALRLMDAEVSRIIRAVEPNTRANEARKLFLTERFYYDPHAVLNCFRKAYAQPGTIYENFGAVSGRLMDLVKKDSPALRKVLAPIVRDFEALKKEWHGPKGTNQDIISLSQLHTEFIMEYGRRWAIRKNGKSGNLSTRVVDSWLMTASEQRITIQINDPSEA